MQKAGPPSENGCEARVIHWDRVHRARQEAVGEVELTRMANIFKLLGDATRLKMLLALAGGEMCVCDLAALTGVSESAVSHQLRRLKDLYLVKHRREGQVLYYTLDDACVREILRIGGVHARDTQMKGRS